MSVISEAPAAGRWTGAARKTSALWYLVALAIAILGVASAGVWGVSSVSDAVARADAFPRATMPGTATINVTGTGDRMIYFSGSGSPSAHELGLKVEGPGGTVRTIPYDLALKIDLAGDVGTAVATFAADERGVYTVTSNGSHAGVIAVGDNVSFDVLPHVIGALALLLISVIVAIAIAIVTRVLRSRRTS